jgi:hypothetical protein
MSDRKMPDDDWDDERDDALGGADDGALHDPLLQQVLDHAPDQAATPDAALSQSIRVLAHEAVAPSLPAGPIGAERPWWQRLLGIGGGAGSRMPWNAAFATVLVGVLVTVMWQREPVPGAAPDAPMQERPAAPVPAAPPTPVTPAPASVSKPAEAPPAPPPPSVLDTALAESRAITEAAKRALDERDREQERQARQAAADREATIAADKAVERAQQALAREEAAKMKAEPSLPPPVQWPPAPEPVAPAAPSVSAAPPAALRAAPPVASVPSRAAGMAAPAPAPAAPAPSPTPEPSFNALAQWTQLRISRNGADSRVLPRAEARELGALVGSVALAGVGSQPLAGAVDWRIALERDGEVLGVLELAGGQVRWREKGVPPGTGQPGAGALSSLRQALEEAR